MQLVKPFAPPVNHPPALQRARSLGRVGTALRAVARLTEPACDVVTVQRDRERETFFPGRCIRTYVGVTKNVDANLDVYVCAYVWVPVYVCIYIHLCVCVRVSVCVTMSVYMHADRASERGRRNKNHILPTGEVRSHEIGTHVLLLSS